MVTFMDTNIEKVREVYGSDHEECGKCKHFRLTDDPIGKCDVPLPGIVNMIWVISKTSKMRCRLYESKTTSGEGNPDVAPESGDGA
jgi:hypothetical protein